MAKTRTISLKVIVLADACASQAIGTLSAEQAHVAALQRMAYLFAAVEDTDAFVAKARALQAAAGNQLPSGSLGPGRDAR